MTPAVANLALAKGTAYDVALVIQDAAAQPIDLAGFTLEASIRAASDTAPVDLAVIVTDAAAGLATVRIPAQPLGMGAWELWMQAAPETPRERALRGLVTVSETVDPREKENPSSHRLIVRVSDTVTVIVDAVDLAWWAYTRAVKAQLETASLAATWPQTVSNGEQAVNTAKNDALDALQNKQADAVLAVGRAQKTATDKIAGAQTAAVSAVQAAGEEAKETIEPLVRRAETAKDDIDQAERLINTAATAAATSATSAANSATAAQQALAALPQVDESGNMTLAGGLTAAGTVNANGGVNIPLAVGAPTDTGAVNRLYAAGIAGVTGLFTLPAYLDTEAITATGTAATTVLIPGQYAQTNVPARTHSTIVHYFAGPKGQWNYSSFAGFAVPWQLTSAGKLTVGLGRGSKTTRKDLTLDSYSIIPGNNLAYNTGEMLDITFSNVRDTTRNGYVIRVREIYAAETSRNWKVKTTTSFIPASQNEPIPYLVNRVIYQQFAPRSYNAGDYGEAYGSLYLLTGGGTSQNLWKIATVRGVTTFETGTGFSAVVTDIPGISGGSVNVFVGSAERTNYQPGNVNPVYYGLEAIAESAIETEETADFVDINTPIEES
ncbi:hypothetical protein [uncultured Akkermansia sp.]|nr:hypothetical protein [uncultured Akkermansia sp.]